METVLYARLRFKEDDFILLKSVTFFLIRLFRQPNLRIMGGFQPGWWNGRHKGLKIPWGEIPVRVRPPPRALRQAVAYRLSATGDSSKSAKTSSSLQPEAS